MSRATTTTSYSLYHDPTELENRSSSRYLEIDETGFAYGLPLTRRNCSSNYNFEFTPLPTTTASTTIATTTASTTIATHTEKCHN